MALSILDDRASLAREVEAELQASAPKSAARNLLIVLGSLVLFVLFLSLSTGPAGILVIVVVLLIHEMGHLIAMKVFGYRDVQMFFIPFLGAAVSGVEASPDGTKRAMVALAGPAPGIALGLACTIVFHASGHEIFMTAARAFLLINTFNLLPFVPLDGGRYLEAVLFSRSPMFRAVSDSVAAIALALIAFAGRSVIFGLLSFFLLRSVRQTYLSGKLARQIKQELAAQDAANAATAADRVPSHYIERLTPLVAAHLPDVQQDNPKAIAAALRDLWNMVWFRPPSVGMSIALLVLFAVCLAGGIIVTLGAEYSFSPEFANSGSGLQETP